MVVGQPLATASDENLSVTLDWVIFRDGPGTWAKNVDWDEYLIRVQNLGDDSIQLMNITVIDSLGVSAEVGVSRKKLVKASKKTKKRYKGQGLKVKAGLSGAALAGTGLIIAAGSSGLGAAAMAGGGAAATAAGVVLLVPALAVGGIVRGVNNSKVNNRIESRQTLLPITLQKDEEKTLDIFFPLSPSPRQVQFTYVDSGGEHTLIIDTQAALEGLHLAKTAE
ncbi:MAG: hypothetical protein IIB74_13310 [Proteobacteria bacterium]|nr:hypothetical protein [Pseudomonadota bacterium]